MARRTKVDDSTARHVATPLGYRVLSDPDGARAEIRAALDRAGGSTVGAAELLGVHYATLKRWLSKLGLTVRSAGRPPEARDRAPRQRRPAA